MSWSTLGWCAKRWVRVALVVLALMPILVQLLVSVGSAARSAHEMGGGAVDVFKTIGERAHRTAGIYQVTLWAALGYLLTSGVVRMVMPKLIAKYPKARDYREYCCEYWESINPSAEFDSVRGADRSRLTQKFPRYRIYFPMSKGLQIASQRECCGVYADVSHSLENWGRGRLRIPLTVLGTVSVLGMYAPSVLRLADLLME